MFPFKRKTASDTITSPELAEEERQRRTPLMFLLFAGSMWLIFAPSEKEGQKQTKGFNTEVPDPTAAELIGDKKKVYEKEMMEEKEQERSHAMQSLSSMFGEMTGGQLEQSSEELALKTDLSERDNGFGSRTAAPQEGFHASASAYQDINRTLGSFYEMPREDPEKEEMRTRLKELESRMSNEQQSPAITVNDQMTLLEKSYQLAAKYMPSGGGQSSSNMALASDGETASEGKAVVTTRNGKAVAFPVSPVSEQVVSALAQPMSDSTFRSEYIKERNYIFHTAIGTAPLTEKNTISACVAYPADGYGRANGTFPSLGTDAAIRQGNPSEHLGGRRGEDTGGTAERTHLFAGISREHHPRGIGGVRYGLGYSSPARWSAVPPRRLSQEWVLPQAAV